MENYTFKTILILPPCHAELVSASTPYNMRSRNKFGMTLVQLDFTDVCHAELVSASTPYNMRSRNKFGMTVSVENDISTI